MPAIPLGWLTGIKILLLIPDALKFIAWAREAFGPSWEERMMEMRQALDKKGKTKEERDAALKIVARRMGEL